MIKLRDLISENDCNERFGNILFKKFKDYYDDYTPEADTPEEKQLYKLILKYIRGDFDFKNRPKELENSLKDLLKCKGMFQGALIPENVKLFRGTTISIDVLRDEQKNIKKYKRMSVINKYKYIPISTIESWSEEWSMAETFVMRQLQSKYSEGRVPVIYEISSPDKYFLFDAEFIEQFGFAEDESIRVTNKPIIVKMHILDYLKEYEL